MSDALTFAEIAGQQPELLPARTVLSTFSGGGGGLDYDSSDKGGDAVAANSLKNVIVFGDQDVTAHSDASADDNGDVKSH